jgi:ABC-type transport system substrate-binding protein
MAGRHRSEGAHGTAHRRADRGRELWAQNDRRIVDQAPWVPLYNTRSADFVSERVGNYQHHPQWGVLVDQLWVR